MVRLISFVAFTIAVLCVSCRKDHPEPKDYLRCNINGRPWGPDAKKPTGFSLQAYWKAALKTLRIEQTDGFESVSIVISDTAGLRSGDYTLTDTIYGYNGSYIDYNESYVGYSTNLLDTGVAHIVYDSLNGRISGSFSYIARSDTGTRFVKITAGVFSAPCKIE